MNENDDDCPICQASMSEANSIIHHGQRTRIHNHHYAHYNCICEWVRRNLRNPTCFCRAPIVNNICRNQTDRDRYNNMSPEERARMTRDAMEALNRGRPRQITRRRNVVSRSRSRNGGRKKKRHYTKKRR
jgi:E3 ubiquitin-protein ligase DOA10